VLIALDHISSGLTSFSFKENGLTLQFLNKLDVNWRASNFFMEFCKRAEKIRKCFLNLSSVYGTVEINTIVISIFKFRKSDYICKGLQFDNVM